MELQVIKVTFIFEKGFKPFFFSLFFLRNQNSVTCWSAAFLHHRCYTWTTAGISSWGSAVIVAGFAGRHGERGLSSKEVWTDIGLLSPADELPKCWVLTYWLSRFVFLDLFGSNIPNWSLKRFLMFYAESFCQEFIGQVCYSPVFIPSGALPGTLLPHSFLIASGAGLDHPVFWQLSTADTGLCLSIQCQWRI